MNLRDGDFDAEISMTTGRSKTNFLFAIGVGENPCLDTIRNGREQKLRIYNQSLGYWLHWKRLKTMPKIKLYFSILRPEKLEYFAVSFNSVVTPNWLLSWGLIFCRIGRKASCWNTDKLCADNLDKNYETLSVLKQ